jgi:hypothetical protein
MIQAARCYGQFFRAASKPSKSVGDHGPEKQNASQALVHLAGISFLFGADGETRTRTAFATTPSR